MRFVLMMATARTPKTPGLAAEGGGWLATVTHNVGNKGAGGLVGPGMAMQARKHTHTWNKDAEWMAKKSTLRNAHSTLMQSAPDRDRKEGNSMVDDCPSCWALRAWAGHNGSRLGKKAYNMWVRQQKRKGKVKKKSATHLKVNEAADGSQ